MGDLPTSRGVVEAHKEWLGSQIAALERGVASAKDGMRVDGDHRPSSRGERGAVSSQGALRAGLLARIAELKDAAAALGTIPVDVQRVRVGPGAVVRTDDGERQQWLAVLPGGQGNEVLGRVRVVSPVAPIARALAGLEEGDSVEFVRPSGDVDLEVLQIL